MEGEWKLGIDDAGSVNYGCRIVNNTKSRRSFGVGVGKTSVRILRGGTPTKHTSRIMNCQKCRTPLKLDSSLQDLNPAAFDLLIGL